MDIFFKRCYRCTDIGVNEVAASTNYGQPRRNSVAPRVESRELFFQESLHLEDGDMAGLGIDIQITDSILRDLHHVCYLDTPSVMPRRLSFEQAGSVVFDMDDFLPSSDMMQSPSRVQQHINRLIGDEDRSPRCSPELPQATSQSPPRPSLASRLGLETPPSTPGYRRVEQEESSALPSPVSFFISTDQNSAKTSWTPSSQKEEDEDEEMLDPESPWIEADDEDVHYGTGWSANVSPSLGASASASSLQSCSPVPVERTTDDLVHNSGIAAWQATRPFKFDARLARAHDSVVEGEEHGCFCSRMVPSVEGCFEVAGTIPQLCKRPSACTDRIFVGSAPASHRPAGPETSGRLMLIPWETVDCDAPLAQPVTMLWM